VRIIITAIACIAVAVAIAGCKKTASAPAVRKPST
jgi:hypothetical protein